MDVIVKTLPLDLFLKHVTFETKVLTKLFEGRTINKHKQIVKFEEFTFNRTISFSFIFNNLQCAGCGRHANNVKFFRPGENSPHIAVGFYCNNTRFTIDHIVPKANGGQNCNSNYQTLCETCNTMKGTKSDSSFKRKVKRVNNIKFTWDENFKPFTWFEETIFNLILRMK